MAVQSTVTGGMMEENTHVHIQITLLLKTVLLFDNLPCNSYLWFCGLFFIPKMFVI